MMAKDNPKTSLQKSKPGQPFSVWDFVSIVSHQLRNPLASTKLSLEMLLQEELGPLSKDQKDYLIMMLEDNQRMIRLVKEFLTISSIERGEIELKLEPVDLRMLTLDVTKEMKSFAAAHNVAIEFLPPESFPKLNLDKLKIRQVIVNLIDNAIKYNRGGGRVKLNLEEDKKNNEIRFSCCDEGIGVPDQEKEMIFTKFFRASNAGNIHPEGTGIGLYISKAVIESSGGKIGFESKEDEGSEFWFTLPIK